MRVSDTSQVAGTGFDRQEEVIKEFSRKKNLSIIKIYRESITGTADENERPVFNEMVQDILSNHCRIVIVERLDRLARDLSVQMNLLALLIRHGITLYCASTGQDVTSDMKSDPMLKALIQIQGVIAELEKNLINRRLQTARNMKSKERGKRIEGKKPFGYYEGEKETLALIKKLYRKPHKMERLGFYKIARILNEKGIPTRSGKKWHGTSVRQILVRV